MITSRQKLILKAIVELYVNDGIPVGSKQLTAMPYLGFSSATIRYDMAELEEIGLLEKTHTSSGRIPSEKGYKYYVENLVTRDQDVAKSYPLIDEIIERNTYSRDQAVKEAIKLISELTNYTAIAVGPNVENTVIKKIDFIPLSDRTAVVLIVTDYGHVQSQNIMIPAQMNMSDLSQVIKTLDNLLKNLTIKNAAEMLVFQYAQIEIENIMNYQDKILNSFIEAISQFGVDNLHLSGLSKVMDDDDASGIKNIRNLIETMDRKELGKMVSKPSGLSVRFSSELEMFPLDNITIISIPYRIDDQETGTIAVVGPTRMEYRKVIPLLEYLASNLGKLYKK